jgi:hypothetical protein
MTEQVQNELTEKEKENIKQCGARIDAALAECGCVLKPFITIGDRGVVSSAISIAIKRDMPLNIPVPEETE